MNWRLVIAVGAAAGATWVATRRKRQQTAADAQRWAAATDPVDRFGPS